MNASNEVVKLSQGMNVHYSIPLLIYICPFIRCFIKILNAVTSSTFYHSHIKLPTQSTPLHPYISDNPKFYPFFKGALGTLDGTHISAQPPAAERAHYRNHKGGISQNVLAATTFNMQFCYMLSGWEGSASDGGVFQDAQLHDLETPEGRYYLADAIPSVMPFWYLIGVFGITSGSGRLVVSGMHPS